MVDKLPEYCQYLVGDAVETMQSLEGKFSLVHLDDAWARPERDDYGDENWGVCYPTHSFEESRRVIDSAWGLLQDGGWIIIDGDDWYTPRVIEYIREEYGDVAETYKGGGFRRLGSVTYLNSSSEPDRSTAGKYLTNGGYSVVFAHKGETSRSSKVSARQVCQKEQRKWGWNGIKPLLPYERWVDGLVAKNDRILVPCAGTAPCAIAAEKHFENPKYVCIDSETQARESFFRRRESEYIPKGVDVW